MADYDQLTCIVLASEDTSNVDETVLELKEIDGEGRFKFKLPIRINLIPSEDTLRFSDVRDLNGNEITHDHYDRVGVYRKEYADGHMCQESFSSEDMKVLAARRK